MDGLQKFISLFMVRFYQSARDHGLSPLNMCFLLLADAKEGELISKMSIAEALGASRAGVDKMIEKVDDLVEIVKHENGFYQIKPTEKGRKFINKILKSI